MVDYLGITFARTLPSDFYLQFTYGTKVKKIHAHSVVARGGFFRVFVERLLVSAKKEEKEKREKKEKRKREGKEEEREEKRGTACVL